MLILRLILGLHSGERLILIGSLSLLSRAIGVIDFMARVSVGRRGHLDWFLGSRLLLNTVVRGSDSVLVILQLWRWKTSFKLIVVLATATRLIRARVNAFHRRNSLFLEEGAFFFFDISTVIGARVVDFMLVYEVIGMSQIRAINFELDKIRPHVFRCQTLEVLAEVVDWWLFCLVVLDLPLGVIVQRFNQLLVEAVGRSESFRSKVKLVPFKCASFTFLFNRGTLRCCSFLGDSLDVFDWSHYLHAR